MSKKNYIEISGDGNISLQNIKGRDININDISTIKELFQTTKPKYLKELHNQIDTFYTEFILQNRQQIETIIKLLKEQIIKRKIKISHSKNIFSGNISNNHGNIHIGDIIYSKLPNEQQDEELLQFSDIKTLLGNNNTVEKALIYLRKTLPNENAIIIFYSEFNQLINDIQIGIIHYTSPEWRSLIHRIMLFIDSKLK